MALVLKVLQIASARLRGSGDENERVWRNEGSIEWKSG